MTRRFHRRLCALALALLSLTGPALAGGGMPKEVVRGDVLPGWTTSDGTRMAAIRLTLAPGWKTYWRAPGDAGIPPTFDWTKSDNLGAIRYHWPSPDVFDAYGLRTIGYKDSLVLPVEIRPKRPGQPVRLRGEMQLGVCETICIPARVRFDAPLTGQGQSDPAIHAALADTPLPARRAGVGAVECSLEPISDGLQLTARVKMPKLSGTEIALVETGDPRVWVSEPVSKRSGDTLTIRADLVPPTGKPLALDRSALRFTVLGRGKSVDIRGCTPG